MKTAHALIAICLFAGFMARAAAQPGLASTPNATGSRFAAIDIRIDPRGRPLAAYQFELKDESEAATIVGVEGGEHAAFAAPPHYDPAALAGGRIIVAAYNTGDVLPALPTRVARIHVRIAEGRSPAFKIALQAAGTTDGTSIEADIAIVESDMANLDKRN